MTYSDGDIVTRDGAQFVIHIERDDCADAPWDFEDGHGPVSGWTTRAKRPGEAVLSTDGNWRRFYDVAAATEIAKRDGWDTKPFGGTKGEKAHRAVLADFNRLRAWCNDEWEYVGVSVTELCPCCGSEDHKHGRSASLWGIESDCGDYLNEVVEELLEEVTQ